ncbi:MAG: hypothetical protein LWW96_07785 [Acidovorax sp.]|uniref:hypothetical protein n=1 Tax=Acidovorax sp. TaxID=1872122 RepID=UPI0025C6CE41|nr:hypothetical protein [Acidovorax sp.]MCE1192038.1 hypothetical protein [Acidovorax sp.]
MPPTPPSAYRWGLRAVIALQCLLIGAFLYTNLAAPAPTGPRLPAVQGDMLWLESHGALHQFNAAGQRLRRVELAQLKLSPGPSSLQFTQENVFWVHDASRVHRCNLSQMQCTALDLPGLSGRSDYRWVRVRSDEGEIVVSDTSAHQVLVYGRAAASGPYELRHTYADGLRFPNQTLPAPHGMWVANTNQHQIERLDDSAPGTAGPARQAYPVAHPGLRAMRRFPFAMERDPEGRLWVLVANGAMRDADVLRLNPQLQPERVVPISAGQDPNAIVLFGQHLLLTDLRNYVVHRLDLQGQVLAPFGDAAFHAELNAARQRAAWLGRLPRLLIGSIGVLLLAALWLAWKTGELGQLRGAAWRQAPATRAGAPAPTATPAQTASHALADAPGPAEPLPPGTAAPSPARITRVQALPGSTRTARRTVVGAAVLMGAVLAWAAYELWPYLTQYGCTHAMGCAGPRTLLAAFCTLPLLAVAMSWRQLKAMESIRIGTDGAQVQARFGRRRYQAPAAQVTCTRQHLLIGTGMIPLRLRTTPLFDEDALRTNIIDRLPQLNMHDSVWHNGLVVHYWRYGGWRGRAIVVGMAVLLCLAVTLRWVLR